jgi:nucleoside-diphosphate-sugar epimerase
MSHSSSDNTIFLAGASGAIGKRLCLLLVDDGWQVYGTTRSEKKASKLRGIGIQPIVVDVFDSGRLRDSAERYPAAVEGKDDGQPERRIA